MLHVHVNQTAYGSRLPRADRTSNPVRSGRPVGLTARRIAFYRDNRVPHRSN
jgi:hypothetical protein